MRDIAGARPSLAWAISILLAAGCRSTTERTYTTKEPADEPYAEHWEEVRYLAVVDAFGQIVSCIVHDD